MRINNIVKFNLETLARTLKGEGKTLEEISKILSAESKTKISVSTVYRYFESNEKAMTQAVEKSEKLQAKVAEAEISTIEHRIEVIEGLLQLAKTAEGEHTRVKAFVAVNGALDSLDRRIGRLNGTGALIQINNNNPPSLELLSDAELLKIAKWEQQQMGAGSNE
jgi:DNA-binding transcriptional MerR regulator